MILIVDDNEDVAQVTVELLKIYGYESTAVTTWRAALAWMKRTKPSAVVLDVMMPEVSGLEMLNMIRQTPAVADVPVFLYTAGTEPRREEDAIALGADGLIFKGSDFECLINKMRQASAGHLTHSQQVSDDSRRPHSA
ncbi:response regulator [soil metagenome]